MENEANENYCQRVINSSSCQNIDRSLYLGINDVSKMHSLTVLTSDRYTYKLGICGQRMEGIYINLINQEIFIFFVR